MADTVTTQKADTAAEKAYAAAAEGTAPKVDTAKTDTPKADAPKAETAKVEAPKADTPKVDAAVAAVKAAAAPAVKKVAKPAAKAVKVAAKKVAPKKVAPKKVAAKKVAAPKIAVKRAMKTAAAKAPAAKTPAAKTKTVSKTKSAIANTKSTVSNMKDKIMATTKTQTTDFTARVKDVVAGAQDRAQTVYAKGTEYFGDYTAFNKGNLEAVVASGKILAGGMQDMGRTYVAEAKTAFATMTADVKEVAAVKSPTELFQLQGKMLRRNLDSAVSYTSKNTEMMVKLANDAFAPLSSRVSLAVEKVRKAA